MTPLETAILRTVAYFDLFDYPLTSWEVWKWLFAPVGPTSSFPAVRDALRASPLLAERLEHAAGFYVLRGRTALVQTRQERYGLALLKRERARRFTRTLRRIPFVRAVFACNSLGLANARAESDIDFFIIAERGHVWLTRLLAAGWAQLRHARPRPGHRQDTFCLSFFITDDQLSLASVRLPEDPHFAVWFSTFIPLYDPHNLRAALWAANAWAREVLPNAMPRELPVHNPVRAVRSTVGHALLGSTVFERFAAWVERRIMAPNLRALANQDTRVVLNDHMLKFHDNDRRQHYAEAFAERARSVGVML